MANTLALLGFIILVIIGGVLYDFIKGKGEFDSKNRSLKEIKDELKKLNESKKAKEGKLIE